MYRGNEGEGSAAFTQRLLSKYAGATLLKTSSIPDDETQNGDVKLIQITSVTPEPDLETPFFLNPEVPHAVRQYYEHNEVARFSFSRSIERTRKRNESMALTWTEKTVLICESKFPTILPRSEVVELQVVEISPIENAVADVTKKVNELKQIEQRFVTVAKTASDDASVNTNVLSMALNSAIDAPVNQGIPMYRREFLTPDYVRSRPEAAKIVSELRDAIDELVRLFFPLSQVSICSAHEGVSGSSHFALPQAARSAMSSRDDAFPRNARILLCSQLCRRNLALASRRFARLGPAIVAAARDERFCQASIERLWQHFDQRRSGSRLDDSDARQECQRSAEWQRQLDRQQ